MVKVAKYVGVAGGAAAILGCLGGNRIIGVAQGLVILSFILYYFSNRGSSLFSFHRREAVIRASAIALYFLVGACLLSIFLNWQDYLNPLKDLKKLRYELIVLLALSVVPWREAISRDVRIRIWGFWLVWGAAVTVCAAGIVGFTSGFNPLLLGAPVDVVRVGGVSGSVMTFSYTLQFFALLSASLLIAPDKMSNWSECVIKNSRTRKAFFAMTFLFLFLTLYLSFCRGAILGVGVGLLALLCYLKNLKYWLIAGTLVLCSLIYGYESGTRYFKNFQTGSGFTLNSDSVRLAQWKAASLTFFDHPIAGIGHRQFEKQSVEIKKKYGFTPDFEGNYFSGHAHNNYLEGFASSGLLGGLGFLAFCIFWLAEMNRSEVTKIYFTPVIIAFLVSGFFENTFTDSEVLHTILLIYFVSQIVLDRSESIHDENL